ncbi:MAG: sigma-70 family RNA polymerase sigma factor [Acidobacteriota bacterium]|nr:sigma-70 family RNA polymerase sigma factor [Acidobacteriota bacterium]
MTGPAPEDVSDEMLVNELKDSPRDDVRAFDALVRRHRARVVANCRFLTSQPEHAEDLAQEVFIKAYFGLRRFRGGSSFRTWVQRIKVNHCLDHLKAGRGRTFVDVGAPELARAPELSVPASAEEDLMDAEAYERLASAIEALPDTLRVPLTLRDLDGLAYEEIARTLGLGLSAAKMRVLRARRTLRARLGEAPESTDPTPPHRAAPVRP